VGGRRKLGGSGKGCLCGRFCWTGVSMEFSLGTGEKGSGHERIGELRRIRTSRHPLPIDPGTVSHSPQPRC